MANEFLAQLGPILFLRPAITVVMPGRCSGRQSIAQREPSLRGTRRGCPVLSQPCSKRLAQMS